jgi:hypothetical protein
MRTKREKRGQASNKEDRERKKKGEQFLEVLFVKLFVALCGKFVVNIEGSVAKRRNKVTNQETGEKNTTT